jgi:hypothetical protein
MSCRRSGAINAGLRGQIIKKNLLKIASEFGRTIELYPN